MEKPFRVLLQIFLLLFWLQLAVIVYCQQAHVSGSNSEETLTESLTFVSNEELPTHAEATVAHLDDDPSLEDIEIDWKGRVVVIGDIHGDLKSLISSLYLSGLVDEKLNWIAKDTLLIQLGDIVDRGSYALQIYKLFDKLRLKAPSMGSKFVGLLGNHEIMNLCGQLHYVTDEDINSYGGVANRNFEWSENGFVGKYLRTMRLAVRVNDSLFVHAGLLPKYARMGLKALGKMSHDLLKENFCDDYSSLFFVEDGPLWTRNVSLGQEDSACGLVNETLSILGLNRMVVGHTIQHDHRINLKCNNKLVLIDTGFSEAIYGKPCLLEIIYRYTNSEKPDFKSTLPISINELEVKSNPSKTSIKYIQVNNLFINKELVSGHQDKKDEL